MYILYEGPSLIDGGPIFVALTGLETPSANQKTGPMLQTFLMRSDVRPVEAKKLGLDRSVCGDCPHRNGTCYVNIAQSPTAIFDSYINGYGKRDNLKKLGRNRHIRIGAYGDPSAAPIEIWDDLLAYASGWTGYTHFPLTNPELKRYCQASADTAEQATLYQNLGWNTYRVKTQEQTLARNEITCPSSKGVQCIACLKCNGTTQNIAIDVHGLRHKIKKFEEFSYVHHTFEEV